MRAVIYCRISDDREGSGLGVQRQRADSEALIARRGWDTVAVLTDNDISASAYTRKKRPGYRQVLDMVGRGEVDAIVAYHTDRLYRRPRELEDIIDLAENITIATCDGDFDLTTSDGRAMARVIAAMAAKSSDDASRRIRRKHIELAEQGRIGGGGRRPFGYQYDRSTVDPDEATLITEAASRVLTGESLRSILVDWRARGVGSVTGAPWSSTTLKRLLCSARLSGQREHRGQIVGPAVWSAILDPTDTVRLRAILSDPGRNRGIGVSARSYLLAGMVWCERCQVRMTTRPTARGKRRYYCSADRGGCDRCGISADRLEADICEAIRDMLHDGHLVARIKAREAGDPEADIVDAVLGAEAELELLATDYAAGALGRDSYAAASRALETRLAALRADLVALRGETNVAAMVNGVNPAALFEGAVFDHRRALVAGLVERITVAPTTRANNVYDFHRCTVTWK